MGLLVLLDTHVQLHTGSGSLGLSGAIAHCKGGDPASKEKHTGGGPHVLSDDGHVKKTLSSES